MSTHQAAAESALRFSGEVDANNTSVSFSTTPFKEETEVTGPIKLKLWVSSSIDDADLFSIIHNVDPAGDEVTYPGQNQPAIAAAYGWLRVSHRKRDCVIG